MRIIVLGCGNIGSMIARDLAESLTDVEIVVSDRDVERARATASRIRGADWVHLDVVNSGSMSEKMKGFDLVVGALPGDFGYRSLKASIEAGIDMVDISFTPENPLELDDAARNAGVSIIPDCGVAPGLSSMLVGYSASRLDGIREAHIMVGGIPEYPVPPLGYTVTWSAEGLIDEYLRDVNIVEGGRIVRVPALSGLEEMEFPGVGKLEAFYTDGLRTLTHTFQSVESLWEKSLRYPGHVEKIRLLRELGFFGDDAVTVEGARVSPRLASARILERSLRKPGIGDILVMKIEAAGRGGKSSIGFYLLDRFDEGTGVSAMARTTGYTASIVAQMLAGGEIKEKGVIPPEKLGMNAAQFKRVLSELDKRGVHVEEI